MTEADADGVYHPGLHNDRLLHIPGATYNGTHAGGGTVSFTVTADGSGLSSFSVGGPVQGNVCTFGGSTITFTQPLPIVSHAFNSSGGTTTVSGSFAALQQASGTFRIKTFPPLSCDSGTVSWTARTTASPAGSAECIAAQAPVSAAEAQAAAASAQVTKAKTALRNAVRQVKKAKKAVKGASSSAAKRRAKTQLRKASRRRAKASRQLRRAKAQRAQAQAALQQALAARAAVCEPAP